MLDIDIYGMSRSNAIGIKIKNFPKGIKVNLDKLQAFVDRRKSSDNIWSTPRQEDDKIVLVSGYELIDDKNFVTLGGLLEFKIYNKDVSSDNITEKSLCRPSHSDYVSFLKYGKIYPGGGMFSGRMMACYAILGGVCAQALESVGIKSIAYLTGIGSRKGACYYTQNKLNEKTVFTDDSFRVLNEKDKNEFLIEIENARVSGDSIGGKIECVGFNVPGGLGGPMFDSFEGRLAKQLFAIPAIKSFSCGIGEEFANRKGSESNDQYIKSGDIVATATNYNGGVNGGITNGEPIVFTVVVKATPSISLEQDFYNTKTGMVEKCSLIGRNDACIVPRAVVLVEAALNIAIFELMLDENKI